MSDLTLAAGLTPSVTSGALAPSAGAPLVVAQSALPVAAALALVGVLTACAASPSSQPATNNTGSSAAVSGAKTPQTLPLIANIKVNDQVVLLEVARTPQQQDTGLMYRAELPPDRGMVFTFEPAREVGLWMKDTWIPLDMVFLRAGVIRQIYANVPPCVADPCADYKSDTPVDQVIELSAGRAEQLGLRAGNPLIVNSN